MMTMSNADLMPTVTVPDVCTLTKANDDCFKVAYGVTVGGTEFVVWQHPITRVAEIETTRDGGDFIDEQTGVVILAAIPADWS